MNIAILGAGSWGTTLAHIFAQSGHTVRLWAREAKIANEINNHHTNQTYLKKVLLDSSITATQSISDALENAKVAVIVVPSEYVRDLASQINDHLPKTLKAVISAAKGLEQKTGKRMSQVIEEEIPSIPCVVLTGPNHAEEVVKNIPTATVLASTNKEILKRLQQDLSTPHFKIYTLEDPIGAEYCGALKNVCAIAVGICAGLNLGDNAKASIITLGLAEMSRVGRVFGAKRETYYGLAGVGDLVATCTSSHSRNRYVGEQLTHNKTYEQIKKEMKGMVAEGANTARVLHEISKEHNLTLPLTEQVYEVIHKGKNLKKAVKDLLSLI